MADESASVAPLPMIDVANLQLRDKVAMAVEALGAADRRGEQPRIFQQGGILVRVRTVDDGEPKLEAFTSDSLRGELARVADWQRSSERDVKTIDPPIAIARDILVLPSCNFPRLRRIATAPYFSRSKKLVVKPGYERDEGVILRVPPRLVVPPVSSDPKPGDLKRAKALLVEELLCDFPFESESDRAHVLAALIYPFVRDIIDAPAPLLGIDAPTPGTGKGLLAGAIVRVATGTSTPIISEKGDNDELRKTVTALLMEGVSTVLIDNVRRKVGQTSLAALLTADRWCDRVLGVSRTITVPNRTLWIVTGNNTVMTDEMLRRTVRVRLDAQIEDPSTRVGFRHDPLLEWVDQARGDLVWAALTLVANWIALGATPFSERILGSFESWARVLGGILRDAGIEGFLDDEHRQRARREADPESTAWGNFFVAWWGKWQDTPTRASELLEIAAETIPNVLGNGEPRSQETRLGNQLARRRSRVFEGLRLEDAQVTDKDYRPRQAWKLYRLESDPPGIPSGGMGTAPNGAVEKGNITPDLVQSELRSGLGNGPNSKNNRVGPIPPIPASHASAELPDGDIIEEKLV
jgi:hypothetical protein